MEADYLEIYPASTTSAAKEETSKSNYHWVTGYALAGSILLVVLWVKTSVLVAQNMDASVEQGENMGVSEEQGQTLPRANTSQ
jgi:hypothetical protein